MPPTRVPQYFEMTKCLLPPSSYIPRPVSHSTDSSDANVVRSPLRAAELSTEVGSDAC